MRHANDALPNHPSFHDNHSVERADYASRPESNTLTEKEHEVTSSAQALSYREEYPEGGWTAWATVSGA